MLRTQLAYGPSTDIRVTWWFGIYVAGLMPLVVRAIAGEFNFLPVIFFPVPLGFIFVPIINLAPDAVGKYAIPPLFVVGPAFYVWHFYCTVKARTRRQFDFLLLLLAAVVFLDQLITVGMATSIHG